MLVGVVSLVLLWRCAASAVVLSVLAHGWCGAWSIHVWVEGCAGGSGGGRCFLGLLVALPHQETDDAADDSEDRDAANYASCDGTSVGAATLIFLLGGRVGGSGAGGDGCSDDGCTNNAC
jgi:hypothetical protein